MSNYQTNNISDLDNLLFKEDNYKSNNYNSNGSQISNIEKENISINNQSKTEN
jgi:hypothetical protein